MHLYKLIIRVDKCNRPSVSVNKDCLFVAFPNKYFNFIQKSELNFLYISIHHQNVKYNFTMIKMTKDICKGDHKIITNRINILSTLDFI